MAQSLSEAVVVVFGATGGVGIATVERLHACGTNVVPIARSNSEKYSSQILPSIFASVDVTREDEVIEAFQLIKKEFGTIDGVVNCVGSLKLKPLHAVSADEWRQTIDINLTSCFLILKHAIPLLNEHGGSVVFVSSAAARIGLANHESIAAAKAGVIGLMKSAATTYARNGIRVNTVAPGLIDTPLTASITGSQPVLKASRSMHALGREGQASEVASAICWLLNPEQSWVTGQTIGVDGGLATLRSKG